VSGSNNGRININDDNKQANGGNIGKKKWDDDNKKMSSRNSRRSNKE
jgi:hypothetical protein